MPGQDVVRAGGVIEVEPGAAPPSEATPDPSVPYSVIYEDAFLCVVDKPAGVVVHPARGHWQGTLVNGLLAREGFSGAPGDPLDPAGGLRPGIVHRIDKDTSGILVVAKDTTTREGLKEQLASHAMEREYLALTLGVPAAGRIETLHGRDPKSRLRFTTRVERGRGAVTHVSVREVLAGGGAALVVCRLETGRTHQIRVHLSECAKNPILADSLYGRRPADSRIAEIATGLGRQALHATTLGFVHPDSGETLRFESALPADMQRALAALRQLDARR
ncbi:MAG: RluA family pseudouridine synthase [Myxococcales bacterium]|nr:RluA family pseudouridine synthase [Myxococcales bacterium]